MVGRYGVVQKPEIVFLSDKEEYTRKRLDIIRMKRFGKLVSFWVPDHELLESCLIYNFGREGKRIYKFIIYRWGPRQLSVFKLGKSFVVVEKNLEKKGLCMLRFSSDVDRWLRYGIVREIFLLSPSMSYMEQIGIGSREWTKDICGLWRKYILIGVKTQFKVWLRRQKEYKWMMNYKKSHIARNNKIGRGILRYRKVNGGPKIRFENQ
jgi:hypothetical protein